MLYPVYVHKDENSAYGAIVPDMPGVHSAVDSLEDLPAALQEAVELMYEDEERAPPRANIVDKYRRQREFKSGFWMLVDIDLTKINTRAVRLNISLPENLLGKIDAAAATRRMSRSAFLALAAEHELRGEGRKPSTE
ncbi:type II toxin-antitoxin system HicB family antitoxin [Xanthomonas theicola]|uniref:CopG family transcriptional regulator n=1 Tax=Xanthomonas theicola TaxID=56464 RepID=A0A2S6ZBL2_9XANT|nr:type II toxin-antitoxin system HicB family antitoxin [Xanthomonas theicola]PPT83898.1 CopG family transcriptional regulator [Xanthomonas theicola]QNH26193.1 ribbon-helix-helix protein, CopG family [Xanthomonas theicola]